MDKVIIGVLTVCVCLSVMAIGISIFRQPIQTIQQIENKTWHHQENKSFYGVGKENKSIQIDSEIWRIEWFALPLDGAENLSLFDMSVRSSTGELITEGTLYKGWPIWDARCIIGNGTFEINVIIANLKGWQIDIYEYY